MEFLGAHPDLVAGWRLLNAVGLFAVGVGFIVMMIVNPPSALERSQRYRYVALIMVLMALAIDVAEQVWLDAPLGTRSVANSIALIASALALWESWLSWRARRADG